MELIPGSHPDFPEASSLPGYQFSAAFKSIPIHVCQTDALFVPTTLLICPCDGSHRIGLPAQIQRTDGTVHPTGKGPMKENLAKSMRLSMRKIEYVYHLGSWPASLKDDQVLVRLIQTLKRHSLVLPVRLTFHSMDASKHKINYERISHWMVSQLAALPENELSYIYDLIVADLNVNFITHFKQVIS